VSSPGPAPAARPWADTGRASRIFRRSTANSMMDGFHCGGNGTSGPAGSTSKILGRLSDPCSEKRPRAASTTPGVSSPNDKVRAVGEMPRSAPSRGSGPMWTWRMGLPTLGATFPRA